MRSTARSWAATSSHGSRYTHTLLGLFPGTHHALVGLPSDYRRMAREFCAMYKQHESLLELLEDVSCTLRCLDGEGRDKRSASPVTTVGTLLGRWLLGLRKGRLWSPRWSRSPWCVLLIRRICTVCASE